MPWPPLASCRAGSTSNQLDLAIISCMRLSPSEQQQIREILHYHFGETARSWLFGSRVDDGLQGGDIDLYIETSRPLPQTLQPELEAQVALIQRLGDRKIDLLVRYKGQQDRPIYQLARNTGAAL